MKCIWLALKYHIGAQCRASHDDRKSKMIYWTNDKQKQLDISFQKIAEYELDSQIKKEETNKLLKDIEVFRSNLSTVITQHATQEFRHHQDLNRIEVACKERVDLEIKRADAWRDYAQARDKLIEELKNRLSDCQETLQNYVDSD